MCEISNKVGYLLYFIDFIQMYVCKKMTFQTVFTHKASMFDISVNRLFIINYHTCQYMSVNKFLVNVK